MANSTIAVIFLRIKLTFCDDWMRRGFLVWSGE